MISSHMVYAEWKYKDAVYVFESYYPIEWIIGGRYGDKLCEVGKTDKADTRWQEVVTGKGSEGNRRFRGTYEQYWKWENKIQFASFD